MLQNKMTSINLKNFRPVVRHFLCLAVTFETKFLFYSGNWLQSNIAIQVLIEDQLNVY